MELRNTEESIQELARQYETIRQSPVLLEFGSDCGQELLPERNSQVPNGDDAIEIVPAPDLPAFSETLTKMQSTLLDLETSLTRFRQRLQEKDPVTGNPRYGAKTQARVQVLVETYDFLLTVIPLENADSENSSGVDMLTKLKERHHQQQAEELKAALEQREQEHQEVERAKEEEQQRLQQQQQEQLEEAQRLQQQQVEADAEMRRLAEAARERRLAQERAEQEWVNGINKGPVGVKEQLQLLKETTKDDSAAQVAAIQSLYTIFQQINARPEETNFRRIRRDHPKFTQDIGRHKGGVEVLIAAGFELGAIDDVPCYLSKEPDIETDMDGWSAWFDLLKATLGILEQEQAKLPTNR